MELTISVLAIAVSLASLAVALLAYRRSGRANAAENEFKDVRWEVILGRESERQVKLTLKNNGTTEAREVRLAASRENDGVNSFFAFPISTAKKLRPGETHEVISHKTMLPVTIGPMYEQFEDQHLAFHVTWKSPLGTMDNYKPACVQLF